MNVYAVIIETALLLIQRHSNKEKIMIDPTIDGVSTCPTTATDLATYDVAEQQVNGFVVPKLYDATNPHVRVYFVLADGTGNDLAKDDPLHASNVGLLKAELETIRATNPNIDSYYLAGPGTQGGIIGTLDAGSGYTCEARAEILYEKVGEQTKIWLQEDPNAIIRVIEIAFSRGGPEVMLVSNLIEQRGIQDPAGKQLSYDSLTNQMQVIYTTTALVAPGLTAQAVGLYDPVATGSPSTFDMQPSASVVSGLQINAGNEFRSLFPSTSIIDQNSTDARFLGVTTAGAHSDIGGGYLLNGNSVLNFNLMAKYIDGLMGQEGFIPKITPPADPSAYVIHSSVDHQWFYRDLAQREIIYQLNSAGAVDAIPVSSSLAQQFVYSTIGGNISPGIPSTAYLNSSKFKVDAIFNTLGDISAATGISVDALVAANPNLSANMSIALGVLVNLPPTTNTFLSTITALPIASNNGVADPTQSISNVANNLVCTAVSTVSGVDNVNTATGNYAYANNQIADFLQPGHFSTVNEIISNVVNQLYPVDPNLNLSPDIQNAINGTLINFGNSGVLNTVPTDPLVLDLNGDGVKLTSFSDAPVLFDINHDGGSKELTGWVSAQDGIVVYDLNGNGKIDDISETMSEYFNGAVGTGGNAGVKPFSNGFAALKSLDSNGNNLFDAGDAAWNNVKVWVDANHDGVTDAGELKTLASLGISSINLASTTQSGLVSGGNEILASGTFTMNGTTQAAQAANFIANPTGNTTTVSATGTTVSAADGQSTYVSNVTTGEVIDVAVKGVKNAYGNTGNDILTGDANANWLAGGQGADTFNAGAGDDVLLIDAADLQANIHAGAGFDMVQVVGSEGVTLNLAQAEVEVAIGGIGNDVFIGGGRSSVFIRGGDGDDIIIGGGANDALSGENGNDLIVGGAGNDLIRGGRGQDQLLGGVGDDIIQGGQDDDQLSGGAGNDVLRGDQGDDVLDGGDGIDFAEYTGSFADYRITKLDDSTYRVVDTRAGRDGADILRNIEKLNFADVSAVDITLPNPMPVKDIITVADRVGLKLIKAADLLANDRDWQGDTLHITTISSIVGGTLVGVYNATTQEWTPTLTANGELQFTPDPNYTGVMSFKYKVADSAGHTGATAIIFGTSTAAEMRGQVFIKTPDMPTDSIFTDQWYLNDINVLPVWKDYTGKGVKIAQFEPGMPFSTGAEVFDYRNPDLQANVDQSWIADPNANLTQTFSNHATLVAGVMVAARNGEGAVGVAYDAKLSGHYIQGTGLEAAALSTEVSNALAQYKNFDVVNNSWGSTADFAINVVPVGTLEAGIGNAVSLGRNGLGTVIVMAGGNDRQNGGNTNANALSANRAVITTGAINAQTDISTLTIGSAPFSNPGASILISAPGSNVASTSSILMNNDGSVFGSSTSTVQGTSFATPIVSGVVALMLEANPNLGWRDVQQILALSARKVNDPNTDTVFNGATNWNGGGMHTSHDYGFGDVDARAAVRLAETWQGSHTSYNERYLGSGEGSMNGAANLGIAIADGAVLTRTLSIGAGVRAEHVTVSLDITHTNWGDLTVELISPTGVVSKLMVNSGTSTTNPGGDVGTGQLTFALDTTHDYGENAQGNWQLRITDRAGRGTGVLNGWKVDVYGSDLNETINSRDSVTGAAPVISATGNNQYFYTDEFGSLSTAPGVARNTLTDSNGGTDTLNAAAVSTGSTINLINGSTSIIAGRSLTVNGDVEWAYGGDGNDTITGNALSNYLAGGRGNDVINGGDGNDMLDGGTGSDTLTGGTGNDFFVVHREAGATTTITDFTPGGMEKILLVGFDNIADFTQLSVVQESANTRVNLGNGQSVLLQNVASSQISEQSFGFFSDDAMLNNFRTYMSTSAVGTLTSGIDSMLLPNNMGNLGIFALGGNDVLGAQTSNDFIDGGDGSDTIWGDYPGYAPAPGKDWLEGGAGNDVLYGGGADDLLRGGSGDDVLYGEAGNDVLYGATGNDYLDGGAGDDLIFLEGDVGTVDGSNYLFYGTRVGGAGADVFKVTANGGGNGGLSASGTQISAYNLIADFDPTQAGELIDLTALKWVRGFGDLSIQDMTINGTQIARITANDGTNQLAVNLRGVNSNALTAAQFRFNPNPGLIIGTAYNDTLSGDAGGNILDGGLGADTMTGRTGDDTYIVDNVGDTVNELPGGGFDTVKASVNYTLSANVENMVLTGTNAINATGNELDNRLVGNSADNVLNGMGGADTMLGGAGNDTYVVDSQADTVIEYVGEGTDTVQTSVSYTLGNNIENLQLTGNGNINATGNDLANTLNGNSGDNIIDGAAGADTMVGGLGNDTYIVDNVGDIVTENLNEGIDTVYAAVDYTLSANVENLVLTPGALSGTGNTLDNLLTGNSANNTLSGGAGDDWLDGRQGADTLFGGTGNDTYVVDNTGDVITENAGEGVDTVLSSISYTLGANVENLTLTGTAAINGTGNALDNVLIGNSAANTLTGITGNDILDGGAGADTLIGGAGNDTYVVDNAGDVVIENLNAGTDTVQSSITYTLGANVENLTLSGWAVIDGTGNSLDNILDGSLNTAANVLSGGAGNDTYVLGDGDTIVEDINAGTDTVVSTSSYTLGDNLENLTLTGTASINGTGNTLGNVLVGNSADNILDGGAGADKMLGGLGDDTYVVESTGDVVTENAGEGTDTVQSSIAYTLGANVENLTLTGTAVIKGTGNALDNILDGSQNTAANVLTGGLGNDTYILGDGDTVVEAVNAGIDTVMTSATYTLGANLENLTLTGAETINGTGNTLDNVLVGNSADNILDGGVGADTLSGGQGNDTYFVDNLGDVVIEGAGEGIDTVNSSVTFTLGNNIENLTLTGVAAIGAIGNTQDNVLTGNASSNLLDGGAGADIMTGGLGDDTYVIDNIGDVVSENANEGWDTVQSSISYTLGANFESLTLTGTASINGTGNELGNALYGNSGDNILDGGAGIDYMAGGLGNDTYVVDTADSLDSETSNPILGTGDVVVESANAGIDTVLSSIDYTLGANVENLTLTGLTATYAWGNELNNVIIGNSLNNVIDGGAGADTMSGGLGNDSYYVDNQGDQVIESQNQGIDTVYSSVSFTLGANIENLYLTGTASLSATGNELDNVLSSNSGIDVLIGGLGNDTYYVGNTNDIVVEYAGEGIDTVYSMVNYTLSANVENLILRGYNTSGTGNELNNVLTVNSYWSASNDTLNGGLGVDTMSGGNGNDTYYVDNAGDVIIEGVGQGTDTVISEIDYSLAGTNLENLTLSGTLAVNAYGDEFDNILTGNSIANLITAGAGNDTLDGGAGADTMIGGLGNDTYMVDHAGDVVIENAGEGTDTVQSSLSYSLGANLENLTLTGSMALNGTGNELDNLLIGNSAANVLTGGAGNDTLDGGAGADTLIGGLGNDMYLVDNVGDVIIENAGEGTDTVMTSLLNYTLGANVENLTLTTYSTAANGTGNELDNVLTVTDGYTAALLASDAYLYGDMTYADIMSYAQNDTLNGGAGADTMAAGLGDDTYIVDNAADVVIENAGYWEGTDTIYSSVSYVVSANVENMILTGSAAINGTGNDLSNILTGNASDNILNGGAGADILFGGLGNDTYVVDNAGDVVFENAGEGTDTVQSSITYTLGANVENLTLTGTTAIKGTGNELDNVLDGSQNTAANVLTGGLGNDTYILGTGDTIVEAANAGIDTVMTSATYTLGANLENLTLLGVAAINGTGNALDNVMTGNSAVNTLNGGAGNDLLTGGLGNDILAGAAGNDILQGGADNDTLSDTAGSNLLDGGAGTDKLTGCVGNEIFIGGTGNDTITTGTGADLIAFNRGDGQDTVVASSGADNTLSLGGGIDYQSLALSKSGNNLVLATGNGDQITLQNWFTSTANRSIADLQIVLDVNAYNANSADPLLNHQVQNFNFALLAQNFDQARLANPALSSWSMTDALLNAHLSGSDTTAMGGDLAYQYNLNGNLTGMGLAAAQTELGNASFGVSPQQLQPLSGLQTGSARLS
jgi:Ca2+-binding RTX toxin-like protein